MANDLNQVMIIGRLTRDSELKYTAGGMAISQISLANGYRQKKGDTWVDETNFFDVSLFGKQAESLKQYLVKSTQIAVLGELRQSRWEQDGQKRSTVKIHANSIQLLAKAGTGDHKSSAAPEIFNQDNSAGLDDDIPF